MVLLEDEELLCLEWFVEWLAYLYDTHFDTLLVIAISTCIYDALWTPCMWLLPIGIPSGALTAGIVIDIVCVFTIVSGAFVWGLHGHILRTFLDTMASMPWELIGLATSSAEPLMAARSVAKVRDTTDRPSSLALTATAAAAAAAATATASRAPAPRSQHPLCMRARSCGASPDCALS
jgi:hypothetical protein